MNRFLIMLIIFLIFTACTQPKKEIEPSLRHMLKSDKLRIMIKQLDDVIYERQMSELDRDRARKRYVKSMAETLKELSEELKLIEPSDAKKSTDVLYKEYAKLLDLEVDALEKLARESTFEYLGDRLKSTKNICNSCHTQFNVAHRK